MRWLDLAHRWTGGLIGLVLALPALSGAIPVWKTSWIGVPHASDPLVLDPSVLAVATGRRGRLHSLLSAARGPDRQGDPQDRHDL